MCIRFFEKLRIYKNRVNSSEKILLGFALIILLGTLLFMLPISNTTHKMMNPLTALYTSVSAVCVTGLTLIDPGSELTFWGQLILILLIQIGGLGFMTVITVFFLASKRNIDLKNRIVLARSIGLESISGIVRITKHILIVTVLAESFGAIVLSCRFVPKFGLKGIWYGVFHSISAYCNAGFDIFGQNNSVIPYAKDPIVLITIALLIIAGGLGFIVWEDLLQIKTKKGLNIYSKIIIISTFLMIFVGMILFFVFECNNPKTIGNFKQSEKLLNSFFQSVTTRTAGFDSIGQNMLTDKSKLISIILMMIGGASGSTAGGIKISTFVLVFLSTFKFAKNPKGFVIYGRKIKNETVSFAYMLLVMWLTLITVTSLIVSTVENVPLGNSIYEMVSAYDTVGLTVGITAEAGIITKLVSILLMYFGRVGVAAMTINLISLKEHEVKIEYPEGNILVG